MAASDTKLYESSQALYCAVVDVSNAQLHDHLLPVNVEKKIKGNNIPLKSSYGSGSEGELDLT